MNATRQDSKNEVLHAFSIEAYPDADTLAKYLELYPQFRDALIDLSIELDTAKACDEVPAESSRSDNAVEAWSAFQSMLSPTDPALTVAPRVENPLLQLGEKRFRELAEQLNISRLFLSRLRDCSIQVATIPQRFIQRLATALEIGAEDLRDALDEPPFLTNALRHKVEGKPVAGEKMSFMDALTQSGLSEAQQFELSLWKTSSMDAVEAARQAAEKLHLVAVERGCDTRDLLRFTLEEADRREIEVYEVPQGDPQLKGGRALYDSQAGLILYENVGTDFDKAFLIAHEIGHLELEGTSRDDLTEGIEPDRSAEAPAIGAERVVDYGSRERREIVMDLFARELLLPRYAVKRWHIFDEMSSEAIADWTGAPVAVVQQQLLDALLLPQVSAISEEKSDRKVGLDKFQRSAALHRRSAFQLQAGPGTGKTRTLVHRIESLLEEGVDPGTILVLTFSNKAAGELRERVAARFPEAVASLWLGTFHSFGLDIVHRFHDRLGLSEHPRVISRYEAIELLEDVVARLHLKHFRNLYDPTLDLGDMLSAISRAKDEVVDAEEYSALAENMLAAADDDKEIEQAEKCLDVAMLYKEYEPLLQGTDCVDFGDLVSLPVRLVESDQDVQQLLSLRHQHILVDEYQDVNRASVRLLKAIAGEGKNLWVVGDSRQSIYRFRGASSINMKRFVSDFPGARVAELGINYRSVSEIIDVYREFSEEMVASEGALPLRLDAKRGGSEDWPELRISTTPDDEIATIAAAVTENKSAGIEYRDQAVLCTSNKRLSEIAENLEALGQPVLYLGSLFERDEVKDLLSLLSLVTDRRATGLVRAATLPGYAVRLESLSALHEHLRDVDPDALGWGALLDEAPGLDSEARGSLRRLYSALGKFPA